MTGTPKIPFFGVDRQYQTLREEILDATDKVYASGRVLDGRYTDQFEKTIAKMTERRYACSVGSCTQALIFALRAVDNEYRELGNHRNKILIPAQSFVATVNAVLEAGFDPVFCDVDSRTGLLNINRIPVHADEIAAIMYVNLFGNVLDQDRLISYMEMFSERKIPVIEDAAQSFGAYYRGVPSGKLGDVSCLSFDPTKNLNNYGSGGMILTDDPAIWELAADYRDNGKSNEHIQSGTNSKMSEADCAQMLVKLKYFDSWQARRKLIADYYTEELDGWVSIPPVDPTVEHAWSKYVVHHNSRSTLHIDLGEAGVETRINYPTPLHLQPVSFHYDFGQYDTADVLEGAENFSRTCLSLPIYPELEDYEVEYVVDSIKQSIG
jgi:dTDP-4-amino-4,6-dideoxygalactose transaminase